MFQTIVDMRPGQRAKIIKVNSSGKINKRIIDMGVVPGAIIEFEQVAPLGDPVKIRIKGYRLSLRKNEASQIHIEIQQ